jgi:O-methyltransferase involved in polyketide biosynthesis
VTDDSTTASHGNGGGHAGNGAGAIDVTVPHSARIWNYWLGGKDNYEVDRAAGDQFIKVFPAIVEIARASRQFLIRAITYLAGEAGVRQFLDVGTGLPTSDNTHEVAQRIAPSARIIYVDNDPMVLAHARALLTSSAEGTTTYIHADIRDAAGILAAAAQQFDFGQPIALILNGVLGHISSTSEARAITRHLVDGLPSGSYLSLMDGTSAYAGRPAEEAQEGYNESGAIPYVLRTPDEIASFFEGLTLVEPGMVSCSRWRPENPGAGLPAEVDAFGGVARKP